LTVSHARAAILSTTAAVSTTVQELIQGSPGSINNDRRQLGVDTNELPLDAFSELMSTNLEGTVVSMGRGFSRFLDPTRLDQPNPEEFALEIGCYSQSADASYIVSGEAEEQRSVVFTRLGNSQAPPEISFPASGVRTLESQIFLSGAVVCWAGESTESLPGMTAEIGITVERAGDESALFETGLTLRSANDGTIQAESTGTIEFDLVDVEELASRGVDEGTLAILRELASEGALVIAVIPPQQHAYRYEVTANRRFDLTARFTARVRNEPAGTGAAAVLGRPFDGLAEFLELALPGVDGEIIQRTINEATADREIGTIIDAGGPPASPPRTSVACGSIGAEAMVMLLFLGFACPFGRMGIRDRNDSLNSTR